MPSNKQVPATNLSGRKLAELSTLLASLPHLSREDAWAWSADLDTLRANRTIEKPRDPWTS